MADTILKVRELLALKGSNSNISHRMVDNPYNVDRSYIARY